jgi:virginiamycin B lyase
MAAKGKKIFISYRREDAADAAGRIRDWLMMTPRVAREDIFMDVTAILPGADFMKVIEDTISQCRAMIVLISPSWLTQINSPTISHVRAEVETALDKRIAVIPVLVGGAKLPDAAQLPEKLRVLTRLNIQPVRHETFDYDMGLVGKALGLGGIRVGWVAAISAVLLVVLGLGVLTQVPGDPSNPFWSWAHPAATVTATPTGTATATHTATPPVQLPHLTFTSIIEPSETGFAPRGLVAGPDNAIWFTEYQSNKIGELAVPGGHVEHEFAIHKAVMPSSIAAGSDGNLWFTEGSRGIGRMTPGGVYTDFPLPSGSGIPDDIVAGQDGNLWFLETGGHIVAMSTSGSIAHDYAYAGNTYVDSLLQGEDGNLWFGAGLDTLVRMTPSGVFAQFSVTCVAGLANGPASAGGANDSIWFREGCARNVVGRISYAGNDVQEFSFPGRSDPGDIVKGSDGNMWLTSNYSGEGRIERCSPSGQIDEFKLSTTVTYAGLGNIISGPDGNLWFAIGGNGIGRFVP